PRACRFAGGPRNGPPTTPGLRGRTRPLLEQDEEKLSGEVGSPDRMDAQVDDLEPVARLDPNPFPAHRSAPLAGLVDGPTQVAEQPFTGHLHHVEAGGARGRLQIVAGVPAELQDLHSV